MAVSVVVSAWCQGCGWTASGPNTDRAAQKHTTAAGHPTTTQTTPAERTVA